LLPHPVCSVGGVFSPQSMVVISAGWGVDSQASGPADWIGEVAGTDFLVLRDEVIPKGSVFVIQKNDR